MNDDLSSKAEEARLLDAIAHLQELKRQRNKNLVNIAKVIVILIVFIYIAMSVL